MKRLKSIMIMIVSVACLMLSADPIELTGQNKTDFRSADMYYNQKIFEKALPLYISILQDNPDHIETLEKTAGIYYEIKQDYYEANSLYTKAINSINKIFDDYEILKSEDKKEAKNFYKKNIIKHKLEDKIQQMKAFKFNCWIFIYKAANEQFKAEYYDIAAGEFIKLLSIAPDSVKTIKMISNCYVKMEKLDKALDYLLKIYEMSPSDLSIVEQIAGMYYEIEDYGKSAIWYDKASKLDPENASYIYDQGICYTNLKDNDNAFKSFAKVIEIDPTNIDAAYNAYNFANKLEKSDEALNYLKIAVDLEDNSESLSVLCFQLYQAEMYDDVLKYSGKWYEQDNTSKDAVNLLYNSSKKLGKEELVEKYEKILRDLQ